MQKSKKFIIEDKQGNNMYPATFADVVYTEDGGNVAEKLKQIEGATPNAHTHTKSQITDFPTSLPANGGNADTVGGKRASDFVSTSGVQLIDLNGNAKVRIIGSDGTAYIQAGNSTNKGDMVLGGYNGVNLTSFDIMSDDKPTINKNPIYHTGNKPTKADVGLGSVNNWGATSAVNDASTTKYATASAVKQAYDKAVEVANANTDGTKVKGTVASNNLKHTISVPARNANSDAIVCKFLGKFHIANGQAGFKIEVSANSVTANAGNWTANFTARIILIPYVLGKTIPPVNSNYEYNSDYGSYGVGVATITRGVRSNSEAVTTQFNASTVSGTGGAYVLGGTPRGLLVDGTYFAIFVSDGNVRYGSHTACTVKISYDAYQ